MSGFQHYGLLTEDTGETLNSVPDTVLHTIANR
jgi:hypothetical protein